MYIVFPSYSQHTVRARAMTASRNPGHTVRAGGEVREVRGTYLPNVTTNKYAVPTYLQVIVATTWVPPTAARPPSTSTVRYCTVIPLDFLKMQVLLVRYRTLAIPYSQHTVRARDDRLVIILARRGPGHILYRLGCRSGHMVGLGSFFASFCQNRVGKISVKRKFKAPNLELFKALIGTCLDVERI